MFQLLEPRHWRYIARVVCVLQCERTVFALCGFFRDGTCFVWSFGNLFLWCQGTKRQRCKAVTSDTSFCCTFCHGVFWTMHGCCLDVHIMEPCVDDLKSVFDERRPTLLRCLTNCWTRPRLFCTKNATPRQTLRTVSRCFFHFLRTSLHNSTNSKNGDVAEFTTPLDVGKPNLRSRRRVLGVLRALQVQRRCSKRRRVERVHLLVQRHWHFEFNSKDHHVRALFRSRPVRFAHSAIIVGAGIGGALREGEGFDHGVDCRLQEEASLEACQKEFACLLSGVTAHALPMWRCVVPTKLVGRVRLVSLAQNRGSVRELDGGL